MDTPKQIFVVGLNDFNRARLEQLPGAENCEFHGIIPPEALYDTEVFDIADMLARASAELTAFDGPIDAIIGYMDFPVSTMLPILCRQFGTRTTSLESLLKCEHKFWSRLVQRQVIPDAIPAFTAIDPFDDHALDAIRSAGLYFPFFLKPIKSSGSRLGFRIDSPEDFAQAIERLREDIGLIATPFNTVLDHALLPPEIAAVEGHFCMAEEIIGGWQCTVEGYVFDGEVVSYGIVDSLRYPQVLSFFHYRYPSQLPEAIQAQMKDLTERVMTHIGYDNAAFNIEYFWDEVQNRVWLLEINTRISQSHCDIFEKVDGISNQQVSLDLGLGRRPAMPYRQGEFPIAALFFYRVFFVDARVTQVPSDEELAALKAEFPGTLITLQVAPGQQLSSMPEQDAYSFALACIWMGGQGTEDLLANYASLSSRLNFAFEDIVG